MARPEVVRRVVGEYGHRQTQQETQSRRHISNESSALANNNNFGGGQHERNRYKSMYAEKKVGLLVLSSLKHYHS